MDKKDDSLTKEEKHVESDKRIQRHKQITETLKGETASDDIIIGLLETILD